MTAAPHAPEIAPPGSRRCPECLAPVAASQASGSRNMFCCTEHKTAHNNRQTVRGRRLTSLAMAARITRGGSRRNKGVGKSARQVAEKLLDKWNAEDKAAGRMPADEYHALRNRTGNGIDPHA